jgi:hypothetical protein
MVVPPPFSDLRHPADQWQTVFDGMIMLAEKSLQNADCCDIQATVSTQADESPPIGRVFFATPRNEKAGHPTFRWSGRTVSGAYDATRAPPRYPRNRSALFNVR